MALSATQWKSNIQNYNGEEGGARSWSNLRNKSYSRQFYPTLFTSGYYFGYQVLYSKYENCNGAEEGYSARPVENLYLYILKGFLYYVTSYGFAFVYYAGYSYIFRTHYANNYSAYMNSWSNYGGTYGGASSFNGVNNVYLSGRSPSAFYQYYGSSNSNVAIGNTGLPYHTINQFNYQCYT